MPTMKVVHRSMNLANFMENEKAYDEDRYMLEEPRDSLDTNINIIRLHLLLVLFYAIRYRKSSDLPTNTTYDTVSLRDKSPWKSAPIAVILVRNSEFSKSPL